MRLAVPDQLISACSGSPERMAWLSKLPDAIRTVQDRWGITVGKPFKDVSCAWVAPAVLRDGRPGVLKLGMPHMEGRDETAGLRFWGGDPTVFLLQADEVYNAMLLERCEPGTPLRTCPEAEQDEVIARLLHRLWREPSGQHEFRPLKEMTDAWCDQFSSATDRQADNGLFVEGIRLLRGLPETSTTNVVLATDLHAGNVLSAQREPWLVIDPKPFVGDPAYDATQHLLNCRTRLFADPDGTIRRFAEQLEVDPVRIRLWTFARIAVMSHSRDSNELARRVAP